MLPLIRCMEEDQKEKLNKVFQEDFDKLNVLLAGNGFSTCDSINITSFKADGASNSNNNVTNELVKVFDVYDAVPYPSYDILNNDEEVEKNEEDHFLPTQPSINVLLRQKIFVNPNNIKRHYKDLSKILI